MADTQVMAYLSKSSELQKGYESLRAGRRIAISFQVRAELGGYPGTPGFGGERQRRLEILIGSCVEVPHSPATSTWYARVTQRRRELRLKNEVSDGDCWVLAQALEHGAPLMCHDREAVSLGLAMGIELLTLLPEFQRTDETKGS